MLWGNRWKYSFMSTCLHVSLSKESKGSCALRWLPPTSPSSKGCFIKHKSKRSWSTSSLSSFLASSLHMKRSCFHFCFLTNHRFQIGLNLEHWFSLNEDLKPQTEPGLLEQISFPEFKYNGKAIYWKRKLLLSALCVQMQKRNNHGLHDCLNTLEVARGFKNTHKILNTLIISRW